MINLKALFSDEYTEKNCIVWCDKFLWSNRMQLIREEGRKEKVDASSVQRDNYEQLFHHQKHVGTHFQQLLQAETMNAFWAPQAPGNIDHLIWIKNGSSTSLLGDNFKRDYYASTREWWSQCPSTAKW